MRQRHAFRVLPVLLSVLGVVWLAQVPSTAAFVATTSNTSDAIAAGAWCVNPTSQTVTANADTYIPSSSGADEDTNYGTETTVMVRSGAGDYRAFVSFPLPSVPAGCTVTAAALRMYLVTTDGVRTIEVQRAAAAWTETGLTYTTRVGPTGTAVTGTTGGTGWQTWSVLGLTRQLYSSGNHGFRLADGDETNPSSGGIEQHYSSREGIHPPELVISWA